MEEKTLNSITDSIIKKLGDDTSGIILDDIGMLLTENANTIKEINDLKSENQKLKERNTALVSTNGKLLQQIPVGFQKQEQEQEQNQEENERKTISFSSLFDEKGNFKRKI